MKIRYIVRLYDPKDSKEPFYEYKTDFEERATLEDAENYLKNNSKNVSDCKIELIPSNKIIVGKSRLDYSKLEAILANEVVGETAKMIQLEALKTKLLEDELFDKTKAEIEEKINGIQIFPVRGFTEVEIKDILGCKAKGFYSVTKKILAECFSAKAVQMDYKNKNVYITLKI